MTTNLPTDPRQAAIVQDNAAIQARLLQLGEELPDLYRYFSRLHRKAVQPGVLGAKTKELMALAISIVQRCDGCISFHVQAAVEAGATRQELAETLGVAIMMGGDPATVYAAQALNAIDAFLPAPVNPQPALIVDDENVEDPFAVNAD